MYKDEIVSYVFVHLMDDFSGSPKVLSQIIDLYPRGKVFVGGKSKGFISQKNSNLSRYFYKRSNYKVITFFWFLISQTHLFFLLLKFLIKAKNRNEITVVINTILPFGATLASKLFGVRIVYYVHETSITPKPLKSFLILILEKFSNKCIYVSEYLKKDLNLSVLDSSVIYNAVSYEYDQISMLRSDLNQKWKSKNVFMACSLKEYKGIPEFLDLARLSPALNFILAINETRSKIDSYFSSHSVPLNVKVISRPSNMIELYKSSFLVLNLSDRNSWIETFGLTIIEAMSAYSPVIVPIVGGPTEVVRNNVDGFGIDSKDYESLISAITLLSTNYEFWETMAMNAKSRSKCFSEDSFRISVVEEFDYA